MKLTKAQKERLRVTPDDQLKKVFPGFTRAFLRAEKNKLKDLKSAIDDDRQEFANRADSREVRKRYRKSLEVIDELETSLEIALQLKNHQTTYKIKPHPEVKSEAVAVVVASDWHYEELVRPAVVNGLNEFNLKIADQRIERFYQNSLRLFNICQRDVNINTIIFALLGDFISGNIHDENMETAQLPPSEAIFEVQKKLMSGIEFYLKHTDCNLVVPCAVGNHSRITDKPRSSTEVGNSLEGLIYHNMAMYYENNPRVQFVVGQGYHTYVDIFNYKLRFHHGHSIRFGGGVGGLTIPLNKAINQWNKSIFANFDVMGHFHQQLDGGNFIVNGSLIGYSPYAIKIKAAFEEPKQSFFLIDKNRGKTIVAPILLDKS